MPEYEAIKARAEAATEGPWDEYSSEATMNDRSHYRFGPRNRPAAFMAHQMRYADAEFIAHARQDIPDLLAVIDKVQEALARHPECDLYGGDGPITCGWKRAVIDVRRALDGDA